MIILLDTNAFIWIVEDDALLPDILKRVVESPSNDIYLSIASIWEMAIKIQLISLT